MQEPKLSRSKSDFQVFAFVIILCFICSLLLAVAAYMLEQPQAEAKEFDQSKQMLIAAKILNHSGYFEILNPNGQTSLAFFDPSKKMLVSDPNPPKASAEEIQMVSKYRIRPLLTDQNGTVFTLEEKNILLNQYLSENKKAGYASLPLKLVYAVLPNRESIGKMPNDQIATNLHEASAFIIPVSGFGLWAPIYGFIAIDAQSNVIGTTWYEHGETPGLGANITEPWWQKQFYGKLLFQRSSGQIDYQTADIGIIVVKGKVKDVYGNSPKSKSAVDGMSGATLTGDGVTQAYRNSLTPYRAFLINIHNEKKKNRPLA